MTSREKYIFHMLFEAFHITLGIKTKLQIINIKKTISQQPIYKIQNAKIPPRS